MKTIANARRFWYTVGRKTRRLVLPRLRPAADHQGRENHRPRAPGLLPAMQARLVCEYRQRPVLLKPAPDLSKRRMIGRRLFLLPMNNPRSANGNLRRKYRERFKKMAAPCGICGGRLGPIRYDQPSDPQHPLSFVIDEIKPVSRWREFGYESPREAAEDFENLRPAHYCCNAARGNGKNIKKAPVRAVSLSDGDW